MNEQWQERSKPARLERRYEFSSYEELRDFLDKAADLSEKRGLYPNIGFGRSYASFTIYPEAGNEAITDSERQFASSLEEINQSQTN